MFDKLFMYCRGRHTFFALLFTVIGTVLAAYHRLDPSYVALVTVIQGFVFGHSIKEDHMASPVVDQGGDNGATR